MTRRRWRAAEIEQLGRRYAEDGLNQLAVDLDRSPDAISSQARRLGLRSIQRNRRRALAKVMSNKTVNIHFFDMPTDQVAFVLGYIWVRGRVRIRPRHVLRLRCPTAEEKVLLTVRTLLDSHHHIQRRQGYTVCEVCSYWLVENLIRKYGFPPCRDYPDPPLPRLPSAFAADLARGLLVGGGRLDAFQISWTGTERAIAELRNLIQTATGMSTPVKRRAGKNAVIAWNAPSDVRDLASWLRLGISGLAVGNQSAEMPPSLPGDTRAQQASLTASRTAYFGF